MVPILGYWKVRGIVEPIRFILAHTETEYKEELYECGPAPDYDRSSWYDVKEKLGFEFPNLPYYIEGDLKLTQSDAILKYLARKHDLCGKTEEEKARIDLIHHQILDYRADFARVCYSANYDEDQKKYLRELPQRLNRLSEFLKQSNYFGGTDLSYVDFMVYEYLIRNRVMSSDCLAPFNNLETFITRIASLPNIKNYLKSAESSTYTMHNKNAAFGGN